MAKTAVREAVDEMTLLDRRILALLPKEGDVIGHGPRAHKLKKPVRSLVEDMHFEYTAGSISGRLRTMEFMGLTKLVDGEKSSTAGWVATQQGRDAVTVWDTLMFSHTLMVAQREGDGLAAVKAVPDGPIVGYAVTAARYSRMADDPTGGFATVEPPITSEEGK
jgi:hypothetical protein